MATQLLGFEAQWEMCGVGRKPRALLHLRGILKVKGTWEGQGCKGEGFILCEPCVVNRPQGIGQRLQSRKEFSSQLEDLFPWPPFPIPRLGLINTI